jgi:hypothetical protein
MSLRVHAVLVTVSPCVRDTAHQRVSGHIANTSRMTAKLGPKGVNSDKKIHAYKHKRDSAVPPYIEGDRG